ncbi:MAG: 2-dehydro-3-deoxygalactonokinase [Deltaproteobacteria bacterium]|nr:2-dehydro-3-deoxygalactonokinase [Deltaproteobacteria bacterium]
MIVKKSPAKTLSLIVDASKIIIVDWGTSSFRRYLLDLSFTCLEKSECGTGISTIATGEQKAFLDAELSEWKHHTISAVYLVGMVTSNLGFLPGDYVKLPARAHDLIQGIMMNKSRPLRVIPGVSYASPTIGFDVIRGEETLAIGASILHPEVGCVCLPGTHSKWVWVENDCIKHFQTMMTGEVFALLRKHSILRSDLTTWNEKLFLEGLQDSKNNANLLHALFAVRTKQLSKSHTQEDTYSYLSGLMIGSEFCHMQMQYSGILHICCDEDLGHAYGLAADVFGIKYVQSSSWQALFAGIAHIHHLIEAEGNNES